MLDKKERMRIFLTNNGVSNDEDIEKLIVSMEPITRSVNIIAFAVCFSIIIYIGAFISYRYYYASLSNEGMFLNLVLLMLILIPQFLRLKWHCADTRRYSFYVRALTVISPLWLAPYVFFYASAEPVIVSLWALISLIAISSLSAFQLVKTKIIDVLFGAFLERLKTDKGILAEAFNTVSSILLFPFRLFRKIKFCGVLKDDLSLICVSLISFLCVFVIVERTIICIILMIFWFAMVFIVIARFRPPFFWSKKYARQNTRTLHGYFRSRTLPTLVIFTAFGGSLFAYCLSGWRRNQTFFIYIFNIFFIGVVDISLEFDND